MIKCRSLLSLIHEIKTPLYYDEKQTKKVILACISSSTAWIELKPLIRAGNKSLSMFSRDQADKYKLNV